MNKIFTHDWFSNNISNWDKFLEKFKNKPNLNFLEVGCFEGRATCWLLENILINESSKISVIDAFPNGNLINNNNFIHNISDYKDKVSVYRGDSSEVLRKFKIEPQFDFVYIDAGHRAFEVIEDAVLVHPLLKCGGILIFDDYEWIPEESITETQCPKIAIDSFYNIYKDFYDVIFVGWQYILVKKIK